jgi:hypothetical protein
MGESAILEIGRSLRSLNPDLDLVILSDKELPPAMDIIRPWVLLRKPFYLPDFIQLMRAVPIIPDHLIDAMEEAKEPGSIKEMKPTPQNEPIVSDIPWLNDVSKAAQHLTRLTLESSAQAALITRENELWAYAGQLSQNAANELTATVSRHWDGQKGNDLLRFVRLESTKAEHMLYATSMATNVILALVFDAETPFSTIRSQANSLAHSLAIAKTGPVESLQRTPPPKREQVQVQPEAEEIDESSDDLNIPSIADILDEIPPPVPSKRVEANLSAVEPVEARKSASARDVDLDMDLDPSVVDTRPSTPLPKKSSHRISQESSPAIRLRDLVASDQSQNQQNPLPDFSDELAATLPPNHSAGDRPPPSGSQLLVSSTKPAPLHYGGCRTDDYRISFASHGAIKLRLSAGAPFYDPLFDRRPGRPHVEMDAEYLHRLWLAVGVPGCAARVSAMGGQRNTEHFSRLSHAYYAPANLGKNLS